MIRSIIENTFTNDPEKKYSVIYCNSSDDKPTSGVVTGSRLMEVDTGNRYYFDEVSGSWNIVPADGGDVVIATIPETQEVISQYGT